MLSESEFLRCIDEGWFGGRGGGDGCVMTIHALVLVELFVLFILLQLVSSQQKKMNSDTCYSLLH